MHANDALSAAHEARAAGVRAGARPAWYPAALGASVALALASFAVPWLTVTGIVLGAVIVPMVIETAARRATGVSPMKEYFGSGRRAPALVWVVAVGAVAAAALVRLKVTDEIDGVLTGAVVVGVVTAWCTWWMSRRRERHGLAGARDDG